jgi:hypothetical protein
VFPLQPSQYVPPHLVPRVIRAYEKEGSSNAIVR